MNEDQIKHMVNRFLAWRLPEDFSPDGGITFEKFGNKGTPHQYVREPTGTSLLTAAQAEEMIRYLLDQLPAEQIAFRLARIASCLEASDPKLGSNINYLLWNISDVLNLWAARR